MGIARVVMIKVAIIAMVMKVGMAANYTIGAPNGGWDTLTDLQTWSASQSFYIGDNLIFQYGANHNVVEVTKEDYEACKLSNAIAAYSDGTTTIPLSSAGKRYFICGIPGHCTQGMKLQINVVASASTSTSPISVAPTLPVDPLSPSPSPSPMPNLHMDATTTDIRSSPAVDGISPFPGSDLSSPSPSLANKLAIPTAFGFATLVLLLPF